MEIEPIFLLNTSIEKLEHLNLISTRVYLNIKALGFNNLSELLSLIKKSQVSKESKKKLENFGQKSVWEVNKLFRQANISVPEYW